MNPAEYMSVVYFWAEPPTMHWAKVSVSADVRDLSCFTIGKSQSGAWRASMKRSASDASPWSAGFSRMKWLPTSCAAPKM